MMRSRWRRRAVIAVSVIIVCGGESMAASREVAKAGIGFGTAFAIAISWSANKSLFWAIIHGLLSWVYVIYYALVYHFH
jgi:hypothetical protein